MIAKIIKQDKIEKHPFAIEHQKKLVASFKESSLSIAEFCRRQGLCQSTFKNWYYKSREKNSEIKFTEVISDGCKNKRDLEIILENKLKVHMTIENSYELISLIQDLKRC